VQPTCSDSEATLYEMGDGGNLENIGLLPMLQRRVRKAVWFVNTYTPIASSADIDLCGQWDSSDVAQVMSSDVWSLFGYDYVTVAANYQNNQVFKEADFGPLACQLQTLKESGKPAVVRTSLEVQENAWWGIQGGFVLDSILVYLDRTAAFEDMLPNDTRDELARSRSGSGELRNFPGYTTVVAGYTAPQVNLLAAQAEYSVQANADLFRALLTRDSSSSTDPAPVPAASHTCDVSKHGTVPDTNSAEYMIILAVCTCLSICCVVALWRLACSKGATRCCARLRSEDEAAAQSPGNKGDVQTIAGSADAV